MADVQNEKYNDNLPLFDPITFEIIKSNTIDLLRPSLDIHYTPQEKKTFYKDLYDLFIETEWKHLPSWETVMFFEQWFRAVSKRYFEACMKFEHLKKEYSAGKERKRNKAVPELSHISSKLLKDINKLDDKLAQGIYMTAFAFGIGFDKEHRKFTLSTLFKKDFVDFRHKTWMMFSIPALTPPVYLSDEFKKSQFDKMVFPLISNTKMISKLITEQLRTIHVNISYPTNVILDEIRRYLDTEQSKYYSKYPSTKPIFSQTKDGTTSKYPFDEWERYLKVHMLTQQGKTIYDLTDMFFKGKRNVNPERQISRDRQKARILSNNAMHGIFPGKY